MDNRMQHSPHDFIGAGLAAYVISLGAQAALALPQSVVGYAVQGTIGLVFALVNVLAAYWFRRWLEGRAERKRKRPQKRLKP
jgi:membrane protein implicated in regulation of membrane protease activity